jgi:hypothetical protein
MPCGDHASSQANPGRADRDQVWLLPGSAWPTLSADSSSRFPVTITAMNTGVSRRQADHGMWVMSRERSAGCRHDGLHADLGYLSS